MSPRVIAFGCDHAAYAAREEISGFIRAAAADVEVMYMGPTTAGSVDYPDYACKVAEAVNSGKAELGVLVCGTGIGMCIAANKYHGIRAALCTEHASAELCRQHNNANVLCVGYRIIGMEVIRDVIKTFMNTPFSGADRHQCRIDKIAALEH